MNKQTSIGRSRLLRNIAVGATVAITSVCSYLTAFLLRFAGNVSADQWGVFASTVAVVVAARLATMAWFRIHRHWNRYFSFHDLTSLVQAVTAGTVVVLIVDALALPAFSIPRSIVLVDWGTSLVLLGAISGMPRLLHDLRWNPFEAPTGRPVLIVGANDAGAGLLHAIRRSPRLDYRPVGFVDDRPKMHARRVDGVEVLGTLADTPALTRRLGVEEVLITSGELPGRRVRELLELAENHGFRVRVLPSYEQLLRGNVAVKPRDVAIGDLLRRPSVQLNTAEVRQWVRGRIVLVSGSAGSIGSEIARQILDLDPAKVVLLDRSETGQFFLERAIRRDLPDARIEVVLADLTDRQRLHSVYQQHRPDITFHAAAYKHVPLMEAHPGEAVKNIVLATRNIVDIVEEYGGESFVMISTDKAVNPTSVMGACKRVAEKYVQAKAATSDTRLVTVRFGNVLDSAGSVVPIFRQQIATGGPVTVTHPEMVRYFMLIPEAAQLVVQAGAMGQGGEIYVLDMGQPVRVMDLARDMVRLSGLREGEDIEIQITGLRPGEKLFEELYGDSEEHQPTPHPKIMVAASTPQSMLQTIADVNDLAAAANGPHDAIRATLKQLVPHHVPTSGANARRAA